MTHSPDDDPLDGMFDALRRAPDDEAVEDRLLAVNALLAPPARPRRFGRFIELGPIGRGGMGEVFEAYDPSLDRRVAIKLVRRDMTRQYRRLEREAKALARLQHPNVVQIYEVGHLDDRLFLAMELVHGDTLHVWQQREPHDWRECLEAYLDAGRGLAAAHDAGLVHRDFKPANCIRDASGRVRVLDFGLVRAADGPDETDRPSARSGTIGASDAEPTGVDGDASITHERLTETGSLVGTRAYMAPECFGGQASDKSDQYGFCVALHQALCGRLPFAVEPGRAPGAPRRALPPPPGRSVPRWLQRALERGLHEDPARRWPSMHALLGVLERGRGRRARVGGISLVVAAVCGLVVGGLAVERRWWAPRCDEPSELRVGVWDDEQRTRALEALLASGSPHAAATWARVEPTLNLYADSWARMSTDTCEAIRVQVEPSAALARQQACLNRGRLALRTRAELLASADATTADNAVQLVEQLPSIQRCVGSHAPQPPRAPRLEREVEALRDELERARAFDGAGKYAEGLAIVGPVLERAEVLADHPLRAEALQVKGQLELGAGDHESAEDSLRRAYAQATALGLLAVELEALTGLIYLLGVAGTSTEAGLSLGIRPRAVLEEPLAVHEVGEVLAAEVLTTVAQVHTTTGELELAREEFERALVVLGEPNYVGRLLAPVRPLEGLAQIERREGRPDRAVELFDQALAIRERWLGLYHPATAHSLVGLCGAMSERAPAAAVKHCQRAIDILAAQPSPDVRWQGHAHHVLGIALREAGELPEAEAELRRAIESLERAHGPAASPELAEARFNLGRVLGQRGLAPEAIREYEAVLGLLRTDERTPANLRLAASTLTQLGELERTRGRPDEAEQAQCEALAIHAEEPQRGDEVVYARTLHRLAEALVDQGRGAAAGGFVERALAIYASTPAASPAAIAKAQRLRERLAELRHEPGQAVLDHLPCE